MENIKLELVGMVWYKFEDYDAILRIMADRDKLPASFHIWLMKAETGEKKFRREGKIVVRTFIDPETFPDWCRSRGLDIDAKARMEFSNTVAYDTYCRRQGESSTTH